MLLYARVENEDFYIGFAETIFLVLQLSMMLNIFLRNIEEFFNTNVYQKKNCLILL